MLSEVAVLPSFDSVNSPGSLVALESDKEQDLIGVQSCSGLAIAETDIDYYYKLFLNYAQHVIRGERRE